VWVEPESGFRFIGSVNPIAVVLTGPYLREVDMPDLVSPLFDTNTAALPL
jgi:hypothetical protein